MDHDTLITYLYFNEAFKIHAGASYFHLGAVISHKCKPITFYGIKLTGSQQGCIVTDKELIITVETLKNRTILLGKKLTIYTDNKNLTCKNFNTGRVLNGDLYSKSTVHIYNTSKVRKT